MFRQPMFENLESCPTKNVPKTPPAPCTIVRNEYAFANCLSKFKEIKKLFKTTATDSVPVPINIVIRIRTLKVEI